VRPKILKDGDLSRVHPALVNDFNSFYEENITPDTLVRILTYNKEKDTYRVDLNHKFISIERRFLRGA
jgi:hypothetical protein